MTVKQCHELKKINLPNFTKNDLIKIRKKANVAKKNYFDEAEVNTDHYITCTDIRFIINAILELWSN